MPPMDQGPGLMQLLSQLQGGGGPMQGPPGMMGDPQDAGEGEGSNPLIQLLLSMLTGQGGGQGMPMSGGGMPQGGNC